MEIPSDITAFVAQSNMDSDPSGEGMVAGSNEVSPAVISHTRPTLSLPGLWPICRPLGEFCAIAIAMAFLCSLFFSDTQYPSVSSCPRALTVVCTHTHTDLSRDLVILPILFLPTHLSRPPERSTISASAQWHTVFSHRCVLNDVRTHTCANLSPDLLTPRELFPQTHVG